MLGDGLANSGTKGSYFRYQFASLKLLELIAANIAALPGVDFETRTTMFQATAPGPGYAIGDIIVRYDIINVATSVVTSTIWFNQTSQATIAPPAPGNITPIAAPSSVTVINGPAGAAVNIQDGGNSITIDAISLDVLLSSRASEASLVALSGLVATSANQTTEIARLTSILAQLDVALSTRASEATLATMLTLAGFQARINTLGQKLMAASTPVVLASDQSAIPVTLPSGAQVLTSSNVVNSAASPVAAGATSVTFTTDTTFAGSINGVTRTASTTYIIEAAQGKTLPAIAYTVTAGSMDIDKLV